MVNLSRFQFLTQPLQLRVQFHLAVELLLLAHLRLQRGDLLLQPRPRGVAGDVLGNREVFAPSRPRFTDGTEAVPPNPVNPVNPVQISPAARAVLDAGRELWRYYHAQPHANPNASYYDIRRHFQGMKTTAKGKEQMNPTSADETYNVLLAALRAAMKKLAAQIEPKVYDYGFLRK